MDCMNPDRIRQSIRLTPAARTRTRSWLGPADGSGTSNGRRTSASPNSVIAIASGMRVPFSAFGKWSPIVAERGGPRCPDARPVRHLVTVTRASSTGGRAGSGKHWNGPHSFRIGWYRNQPKPGST